MPGDPGWDLFFDIFSCTMKITRLKVISVKLMIISQKWTTSNPVYVVPMGFGLYQANQDGVYYLSFFPRVFQVS